MSISTITILLPILISAFFSSPAKPLDSLPPVMLWAWERPEKLDFIDTQKVGVAYLAKTITLRGDKTLVLPRLQPLEVGAGTKLIAVVRIETDRPALSRMQLHETARAISSLSVSSVISVVQIDFDATISERNFYRDLLIQIRHDLPPSVALSITALASWCASDNWLADLPIDEAVPMLFRMGADSRQFQRRLETGQPFESSICQNVAGVSTDELVKVPSANRIYIFNPQPWTNESFDRAMEAYRR
jgi:hypothetical protein